MALPPWRTGAPDRVSDAFSHVTKDSIHAHSRKPPEPSITVLDLYAGRKRTTYARAESAQRMRGNV